MAKDIQEIINLTKENQKLQAKLEVLESMPPKVVERVIEKVVVKIPDDLEQREKDIADKDRQATKILKTFSKLEREIKEKDDARIRINNENWAMKKKIEKLEAQEEVSRPSTIDAVHAKKLNRMLKELTDWTLPEIMEDVRRSGGEMQRTRESILSIIALWNDVLEEMDGNKIIDIGRSPSEIARLDARFK